uniref:7TM GPCR serpentine receptor class x (Srx) domain-containing protein n=1 Tax=Acrobeloides nanus TaxID=290746 RepID=A0A914EIL0_9BILA
MIQGAMMIANSNFGYVISIIFGGLGSAVWLANIMLTLVLSINRFDALICPTFTSSLPIYKQNIYKALLLLTYTITILNFIFFMVPGFRIQLNITSYDSEQLATDLNINFMTTIIALCLLGIACVLYLIALVMLFLKRHMMQTGTNFVTTYEIRLFIQTVIICGCKSTITVLWTFYWPPTPLAYCIYFSAAILESGYNPYLYFAMNRTFRRQILDLILKKDTPRISAIIVTPRTRNSIEPTAVRA